MHHHLLYSLLAVCLCMQVSALDKNDKDITLRFIPVFNQERVQLNKYYYLPDGDSISFSTFKFYVSGISLMNKDGHEIRYDKQENYYLLDLEGRDKMTVSLKSDSEIIAISCYIGVDSEKSVSGAMGGDLDPEHGMYWAWQSGYINFKIEGTCNKVPARNHEFQYHVGGYAGKDKAIQWIGDVKRASNECDIYIVLDKFLAGMDMSNQYSVMIPGEEAVQLAKQFAQCFLFKW